MERSATLGSGRRILVTRTFDAIVIGTGQSGPSLALRMAKEGWKVAVIERDRPGGTCVNTGCIPTKTLVASAKTAASARRAAEYGIAIDGAVRADMQKVKERMRAVSGGYRDELTQALETNANIAFLRGHGRLAGPGRVEVGGEELRAEKIFLNVGARAAKPDVRGTDDVEGFDNASLLAYDGLPEHLVVVGGSYVGLELGQIYRRLGSEVTIVERGPRLVPREDEDVSDAVRGILEREGISVRVDAACTSVAKRGKGVVVQVACEAGAPEIVGSHLLFAIGRVPNTDDLGLERAGVKVDARGYVQVDDELRTSANGIWALGDCNGRGAFTHTSYNDYEIVAANLFDGGGRKVSDRIEAYALYIDPPLGRCGMTERAAREKGFDVLVGTQPMKDVGRAREKSETEGFLKVVVDAKTQRILGAALLGVGCDEIVHTVLDVMYAKAPYTTIARAMHIHPTVSEYLPVVFQSLKPA
jgi:pyruvate/2-oxoglutarate dehydrogenase complex dihydrolipoamide dehydrogenase (E3) component